MEQKKSYQADLEHRRTTGFLLGLIFVFSLFIVAMDYTSAPPDDEMDEEMVEDIVQDLEFYTEPQQDMMLAPLPETKQVTEKINPVEQILQQELPDLAQQQQMAMAQALMQNANKMGEAPQEGSMMQQINNQLAGGMNGI